MLPCPPSPSGYSYIAAAALHGHHCLVQALANTQAYLPVMSVVILLVFNFCAGNVATCLSLLRTHGSWQIDALHAHIQCGAEQRSRTRILRFSDFKKLRSFF